MTEIRILRGPEAIRPAIDDIARLRIRVFRDWPYLYDGTMEEETTYLSHFADSTHACVGLALDGDEIVGATTAEPLPDTHEDFSQPLIDAGLNTSRIFYFGESILLPDYRGQGIGHAFFDLREAAAKDWGAEQTAFCAVQRPDTHPGKPSDYRPLDAFWKSRGYTRRDDLVCTFDWKDVGEDRSTSKPLMFWIRDL
jgi:GNAT superfamily N-acetyltransferase